MHADSNENAYVAVRQEVTTLRQKIVEDELRAQATAVFARRCVGMLVIVFVAAVAGSFTVLVESINLDVSAWVTIIIPSIVGALALLTYFGIQASKVDCEPSWFRGIRAIVKAKSG